MIVEKSLFSSLDPKIWSCWHNITLFVKSFFLELYHKKWRFNGRGVVRG
jgi:hypothetical protein